MPELKLLRIEDGDSQKNISNKVNYNFQEILVYGGGPYGRIGSEGPQGFNGLAGPIGSYGDLGLRGSVWTIGPSQPSSGINGDYWMDTDNNNSVYVFSNSIWSLYGVSALSNDLFDVIGPLDTSSGPSTKYGYFLFSGEPISYTMVLSDATIVSGNSVSPNTIPNPQYSKMVVSIYGNDASKNIMEFNKGIYQSSIPYSSGTPKFYWLQGATAERGSYGLGFKNGGSTTFRTTADSLIRSTSGSVEFSSTGININSSSTQDQLVFNLSNGITFNTGTGTAYFSTNNFSYNGNKFTIPLQLNFQSNSSLPALTIQCDKFYDSGIRYYYAGVGTSLATLMNVKQRSFGDIFNVYGNGLVYLFRRVNTIQDTQIVDYTVISTVSSIPIDWVTLIPTVATSVGSGDYVWVNRGSDISIARKTPTGNQRGVCLWTPATGGTGSIYNKGWLNLLENGEAINLRVHANNTTSSAAELFRYVGLNTSENQALAPNNTASSNYSYADLSGTSLVGASTIDFTIVNIQGTGRTSGTRRWFKVYYSAWGGGLTGAKCGVLSTYNATA
jgi:hypothetical protein